MTSLTLNKPSHITGTLILPPNLLKLSIRSASSNVFPKVEFPPKLVDLELEQCGITLTTGWLNPARLKRLSLSRNKLSSFNAFLPCCEFLCLSDNKIKRVQIRAPVLEHIDLSENMLKSIPKLPASLQVLVLSNNRLHLSRMSEFPSNLKLLDLSGAGYGAPKKHTFPSSIRELHLTKLDLSDMRGVKFAKGSKLKELNMSICRIKKISDRMIELPLGLKSLNLCLNRLQNIDDLTIPQTVTFLDLRENDLNLLQVKSHIETLYLNQNRLSRLAIPKDLELKFLDLTLTLLKGSSFDIFGAEKLTQLRLGQWHKVIDLSKMPVNLQVLEYQGPGTLEVEGFHRYPGTSIYRRLL